MEAAQVLLLKKKLLDSLGSHNAALEKLILSNYGSENDENSNNVTSEQSTSLQSLSKGCLLLHTLYLYNFKNLSTSDISYLLNHSMNLSSKLTFIGCDICKDGGVITKDEGKLKYLERLELCNNLHITD